jgi:hypothetical protein
MRLRSTGAALILLGSLTVTGPSPVEAKRSYSGYAAHYRPGLMAKVSRNRGLPVVSCMVASPFHRVGTWLTVTSRKNGRSLRCRVTDVPHPRDRARIVRRGIVVEVDFTSAKALFGIRRVGQLAPRDCKVIISL